MGFVKCCEGLTFTGQTVVLLNSMAIFHLNKHFPTNMLVDKLL